MCDFGDSRSVIGGFKGELSPLGSSLIPIIDVNKKYGVPGYVERLKKHKIAAFWTRYSSTTERKFLAPQDCRTHTIEAFVYIPGLASLLIPNPPEFPSDKWSRLFNPSHFPWNRTDRELDELIARDVALFGEFGFNIQYLGCIPRYNLSF